MASGKTDQSCYFYFKKRRRPVVPYFALIYLMLRRGVSLAFPQVPRYLRSGCATSARLSRASKARRAMISVSSRPSSLKDC